LNTQSLNWKSKASMLLAAILLLALVVRVTYFVQYTNSPLVAQYQWKNSDMSFFYEWSNLIKEGDIYSDKELHPYHNWHEDLASKLYSGVGDFDTWARAYWNDWYGGKSFHQAPFYAYLLSVVFSLSNSVLAAYILQLLLGLASILLVYKIAEKTLGVREALLATLFLTLSSTFLLYEMVLLRTTLIIFTNCLLTLFLVNRKNKSSRFWLVFGLVSGLAYLLKPTFIFYFLIGLVLSRRKALLFVGAFLLSISPLLYRNHQLSVPLLSVSSVGPITIIAANTVDYNADYGWWTSKKEIPEILRHSDGSMKSAVFESLKRHDLSSYFSLSMNKLGATFKWFEEPNNINYYYYQLHASILKYLPFNFSFLACLSVLGFFLSLRRSKAIWPLYFLLFMTLAPMIVLYPVSRFRVVLLPVLAIFAAFCVFKLIEHYKNKKNITLILSCVALFFFFVFINRESLEREEGIRLIDYSNPLRYHYMPQIEQARSLNKETQAKELFEDFLTVSPTIVTEMHEPKNSRDKKTGTFYSYVFRDYANSLQKLGFLSESQLATKKAERLASFGKRDL